MADNTTLNKGVGGDTIRDLSRPSNGGVKTQVVALDLGGGVSNPEKLIQAGPQGAANSIPVVIALDQQPIPVTGSFSITESLPSFATPPSVLSLQAGDWSINASQSGTWNVNASQSGTWNVNITNSSIAVDLNTNNANVAKETGGNLDVLTTALNTPAGVSYSTALGVQGVTDGLPLNVTLPNYAVEEDGVLSNILAELQSSAEPENAEFISIVGSAESDYAGLPLFEQLMNPNSGENLNVRIANAPKVDSQGAQMFSDAPAPITWYNGAVGPGPLIDTTGYESIVVSFSASQGTYLFQTSNDLGQFTPALNNATGWNSNGSATPATSFASVAGANLVFPITGKYFRLYCSVAGTAGMITIQLRAGATSPVLIASPINVSQIGSNNLAGTGVVGMFAVGGNIAIGVAPTANPVLVGGADQGSLTRRIQTDSNGATIASGALAPGWSFNNYNVSYSTYTTAQSSLTATLSTINPIIVGGTDTTGRARRKLLDSYGATIVNMEQTTASGLSVVELLSQILAVMRANTFLLSEFVKKEGGIFDDPDSLVNEYLNSTQLN